MFGAFYLLLWFTFRLPFGLSLDTSSEMKRQYGDKVGFEFTIQFLLPSRNTRFFFIRIHFIRMFMMKMTKKLRMS